MKNQNAFVHSILPNASGTGENGSIHQTNPAWVLTFLRWAQRDTLRTEPTDTVNSTTITGPLVVENDCIQCSVADSKGTLTPTMSATLLLTDVNYATAINPGDFVFVNMLAWEDEARDVANRARNLQPINGVKDGFKGFFKIQGVRKNLVSDPGSGTKMFAVKITGYAFTEFNNSIYFNPYLVDNGLDKNLAIYNSEVLGNWSSIVSQKGLTNIQDIIKALIETFIGTGVGDTGRRDGVDLVRSANLQFFMPSGVGQLLGVNGLVAAKDAYTYLFGIQEYAAGAVQSLGSAMNPVGTPAPDDTRFIYCSKKCQGDAINKSEYWNNVKLWSIMNQYVNSPINELYTCFRLTQNNRVMPTVVFRQIPFTTDSFSEGNVKVTKFMNVPRWKIDPALAYSFDLGKDEAARINFVQYFGRSTIGKDGFSISDEIAHGNYLFDIDDVRRNGLRPYIATSIFDEPLPDRGDISFRSPGWAKILGDALMGGHNKMSGTIVFYGIPDPLAVGDNLEFDSVVYHIESITHSGGIDTVTGKKTFRTTVTISNGVSTESNTQVRYDEMDFSGAYQYRQDDYNSEALLPGVSEAQDTVYRTPGNPDGPHSPSTAFQQPDTGVNIDDTSRDD